MPILTKVDKHLDDWFEFMDSPKVKLIFVIVMLFLFMVCLCSKDISFFINKYWIPAYSGVTNGDWFATAR
jgi:hypothetical protein